MDEPTNHLDMESIEALNLALENYAGTLIFVSHDREFVSSLATRIIELSPTGVTNYSGTTMKLLIRNLARTTTETELQSLFEPFGTVQSCTLVMDKETGQSKGFGFVEMPKLGDAKAAMKSINGKEIAGSKLRVKKAETK